MGNADSHDEQEVAGDDPLDGIETLGYRVLGVQPNSPASAAGLVSFLDFLVGANGEPLLDTGENVEPGEEYQDIDLPSFLQKNKGQAVELLVWNIKSQSQRFVDLVPNDDWGGAGLLGVTIRLDNYANAEERLIRVLSLADKSCPAAIAGLVPMQDYLLGTTMESFDSTSTLARVLQQHEDQLVEIYVYNADSDCVRVVPLYPTRTWTDDGYGSLLGAEVGTGYLHRLPNRVRDTPGSSVERKVRYISHDANPPAAGEGESGKRLEMEPQLEMEVPPPPEVAPPPVSAPARTDSVEEVFVAQESTPTAAPTAETTAGEPPLPPPPVEQPPPVKDDEPAAAATGSPSSPPIARTGSITRSVSKDETEDVFAHAPRKSLTKEEGQALVEESGAEHDKDASTTPAVEPSSTMSPLPPPPHMHTDTPPPFT